MCGNQARLESWLGQAAVPIQFAQNAALDGIVAVGILTEGEAIVIKSPLIAGSHSPPANNIVKGLAVPQSDEEPCPEGQSPSTFAMVLDSIEQAIETAAEAVETMAGAVLSPRDMVTERDE